MVAPKLRRLYGLDRDVVRIQDHVGEVLDYIAQRPFYQGVELAEIALASGATTLVQHGLGRTVKGWTITRIDAAATVYDQIGTTSADLTQYLPLYASAACTVNLVVF